MGHREAPVIDQLVWISDRLNFLNQPFWKDAIVFALLNESKPKLEIGMAIIWGRLELYGRKIEIFRVSLIL